MGRTITKAGIGLDVGRKRNQNEDSLGCRKAASDEEALAFGDLFVLADGMGGHAAGAVASRLAVDNILETYYSFKPIDAATGLRDAILSANERIYIQASENPQFQGMGTTCVCSAVHGDKLYTAHVGDSRAYLLRDGVLKQITQDHSWVEEQVRSGLLTAEQARHHPMKNVITRALGNGPDVDVELSTRGIVVGDVLLICSDGLTAALEDEAIEAVLIAEKEPQVAVDTLVEKANEAGGPDNIGIIAVRIDEVVPIEKAGDAPALEQRPRKGWTRFLPFA